jgi:rod shape-determining protein MreD
MTIRMNRTIAATLLLVVLETCVVPWLIPPAWSDRLFPHLAFIMTVYVAVFGGRHRAFFFGLGFGLLQDELFYGHMIGAYSFGMALLGYLCGLVMKRSRVSLAAVIVMAGIGSGVLDTMVYWIYELFSLAGVSFGYAVYNQVLPTLLLQAFLALLLYLPVRRWLVRTLPSSAADDGPA